MVCDVEAVVDDGDERQGVLVRLPQLYGEEHSLW